jgi:glycosyltransferase involved in cell wall biosynthesis
MTRPDLLLLSLGTTLGWRIADSQLVAQLRRVGVSVEPVSVRIGAAGALRRAYPMTDLVEAVAARRALAAALDAHSPRAVLISTTTAAMLADTRGLPYAVRFDAPAVLNRRDNASLHALERRALGRARLTLPWSEAARAAVPHGAAPAVVVPPPVTSSGPPPRQRTRTAVAYTPDVKAKGLDVVVGAWAAAALDGAELEVFGVERERALAHLERTGTPLPAGVHFHGKVAPERFRAALRAARVYAGGARWEDFGQAPLEALADGALLATVPSGGPFEALAAARELAPELVADAIAAAPLAAALRAAFDLPDERARAYRERAAALLERFRPEAIQRTLTDEVVPALLG